AAIVQSIMYRGSLLSELYYAYGDTSLLREIYRQYSAASKWYELMIETYQSEQLNLSSGIYEQVPYPVLANTLLELYSLTGNKEYIPEIYTNLELKNYYTLLKSVYGKNNQVPIA